jgi:predicted Zn-dependent protease
MSSAGDPYALETDFAGFVESPLVPGGRAKATLRVKPAGLSAELADGSRFQLAWTGLSIRRGGASGHVVFCRPPAGAPLLFTEEEGFLRAIESAGANDVADEIARLSGERVAGRRMHAILLVLAFAFMAGAIWSIPHLFRWTVESSVAAMPSSVDREIGQAVWQALDESEPQIDDEEVTRSLETLLHRLVPSGSILDQPIELRVVRNDEPNAFALPGGFLTVYTGLVREAGSPEQVAAVLAHELAHVELRHGLARIAHQIGMLAAVRSLFGDSDGFVGIARDLFQLATVNDYSREQERAADLLGVQYLARAKIDPEAMADFFALLEARYGSLPSGLAWMSTHPLNEERLEGIRGAITKLPRPIESEPLAIDWPRVRTLVER